MSRKFKKGAASFYIVAFSTLILVVIATGFATVILSEISRTANDDLSQSAYDSALAGIEDAKVAYSNYRRCKEAGAKQQKSNNSEITCGDIVYWVEHDYGEDEAAKCAMVGRILGKIGKDDTGEVTLGGVQRTSGSKETTTNQAYTCVTLNTDLKDYRTTLNDSKKTQMLRASMGNGETNAAKKIKISWYSVARFKDVTLGNYAEYANNKVIFPKYSSGVTAPPIVEVQIVQTAKEFGLDDFDKVESGKTDRATLFFVPTSTPVYGKGDNYIGLGNKNVVSANDVVKTNDRTVMNKAFSTYCPNDPQREFYCNVEIELPGVIRGGDRSNHTFTISISLPYQRPSTDFSIELCDESGCNSPVENNQLIDTNTDDSNVKKISNVQIAIDSTGRANDLYRRVEARVETADTTFGAGYPLYALEVLGQDGISKDMKVAAEQQFYF